MQNKLILRGSESPFTGEYADITQGSTLSYSQLDGNLIYLKGQTIYDSESTSSGIILKKLNGENLTVDFDNYSNTELDIPEDFQIYCTYNKAVNNSNSMLYRTDTDRGIDISIYTGQDIITTNWVGKVDNTLVIMGKIFKVDNTGNLFVLSLKDCKIINNILTPKSFEFRELPEVYKNVSNIPFALHSAALHRGFCYFATRTQGNNTTVPTQLFKINPYDLTDITIKDLAVNGAFNGSTGVIQAYKNNLYFMLSTTIGAGNRFIKIDENLENPEVLFTVGATDGTKRVPRDSVFLIYNDEIYIPYVNNLAGNPANDQIGMFVFDLFKKTLSREIMHVIDSGSSTKPSPHWISEFNGKIIFHTANNISSNKHLISIDATTLSLKGNGKIILVDGGITNNNSIDRQGNVYLNSEFSLNNGYLFKVKYNNIPNIIDSTYADSPIGFYSLGSLEKDIFEETVIDRTSRLLNNGVNGISPYATENFVNETISASTQSLQKVTDVGNTTTNLINGNGGFKSTFNSSRFEAGTQYNVPELKQLLFEADTRDALESDYNGELATSRYIITPFSVSILNSLGDEDEEDTIQNIDLDKNRILLRSFSNKTSGDTSFQIFKGSGATFTVNNKIGLKITDQSIYTHGIKISNSGNTSNLAIGFETMENNIGDGNGNTAIGYYTMRNNTYSYENTAIGVSALETNNGSQNVAIGKNSIQNNNGSQNVSVGYGSLINNSGSGNVVIGSQSLTNNSNGQQNIAIGQYTLRTNSGSANIGIGSNALNDNNGQQNIALGANALNNNNNSGSQNVAIGNSALNSNNNGQQNIAFGGSALYNNSGSTNIAIGVQSLFNNSGSANIALGGSALYNNSGSQNVAIGNSALNSNTTGSKNIAFGFQAGGGITTGSGNIVLGTQVNVGAGVTTGANNIIISRNLSVGLTTGSGNTIMGVVTGVTSSMVNNVIISDGIGGVAIQKLDDDTLLAPNQTTEIINGDSTGKAIVTIQYLLENTIPKNVGPTYTTGNVITVTQAEYDAIVLPNPQTLYFII